MSKSVLLICNKPKNGKDANTISDHINAISKYSINKILVLSNLGEFPNLLDINKFDVIIIHYSICLYLDTFISRKAKNKLREFNGLKVVFIQDEYRQINKTIKELNYIRADVLFTCFPDTEKDRIYSKDKLPRLNTYNNLTGYIPERLLKIKTKDIKDRPISISYRGRKIPYWLGELAYEKSNIVDKWKEFVLDNTLNVDISYNEQDRIYGKKWIDFLASSKATLGVESGASVMDFTGKIEEMIRLHNIKNPEDDFPIIKKKYLFLHEGKYNLNQISPRCFEAIALKTALVLYEGEYSGILIPGKHFIMLKKDFSNISDVLLKLKDDGFLQKMVDITYKDIVQSTKYTYNSFISYIDEVILKEFSLRAIKENINSYSMLKLIMLKPALFFNKNYSVFEKCFSIMYMRFLICFRREAIKLYKLVFFIFRVVFIFFRSPSAFFVLVKIKLNLTK